MNIIDKSLIAPCGMDCALCSRQLRENNKCGGCNDDSKYNQKTRIECAIKNCSKLNAHSHDCGNFPCRALKQLDARYRKKYRMSMIENLVYINEYGMNAFLKREAERWTCPKCGSLFCVHTGLCPSCGAKYE